MYWIALPVVEKQILIVKDKQEIEKHYQIVIMKIIERFTVQ